MVQSEYKAVTEAAFKSLKQFSSSKRLNTERDKVLDHLRSLEALVNQEKVLQATRFAEIERRKSAIWVEKIIEQDENLSRTLHALIHPLLPTEEEKNKKNLVISDVVTQLRNLAANAQCQVFGSSKNGLSFSSSDVDISLNLKDFEHLNLIEGISLETLKADAIFEEKTDIDMKSEQELLRNLKSEGLLVLRLAQLFRSSDLFQQVESICSARVPLLKLVHKETGIQCDIAIGNNLAVHNTQLLKAYCDLDPKIQSIVLCIKLWAKRRKIGDASDGFLSSYAWTLLVLYYLQHIPQNFGGPLIPNIQLKGTPVIDEVVEGYKIRYSLRPKELHRFNNKRSLGKLFRGFFSFFYGDFNYVSDEVSFERLSRQRKNPNTVSWRISIIDPFELTHDLGTTLSGRRAQIVINDEIWRAHSLLVTDSESNWVKLFSTENISNIGGRLCMNCGETGHRAE